MTLFLKDFSYFAYVITQGSMFLHGTPYIGEWSHHSKRFLIQVTSVKRLPVIHWGLFIHLIGCKHDQDLGDVFKLVGDWSPYLEKKNA